MVSSGVGIYSGPYLEGCNMTNDPCLAVKADLVAFLDEELPSERATAVRAHLSGCAGCQAECDALAGAWKSLDLLPGLEPRAGLFAEIEARVLKSEPAATCEPAATSGRGELTRFPAGAGASSFSFGARVLSIAAAALVTAGLGFGAAYLLKESDAPERSNEIAVQPAPSQAQDGPGPIDMGHGLPLATPDSVGTQTPVPQAPQLAHDAEPEIPRVKIPVEQPETGTEQTPQTPDPRREAALASAEWDALDPEEREVVENLELLISLEEVDDLEVLETLEVLDDLTDEELGEG